MRNYKKYAYPELVIIMDILLLTTAGAALGNLVRWLL